MPTLPLKLSQRWHYAKEQAISFLMQQAVENPQVISLAAGLVDAGSLPVAETLHACQTLLSNDSAGRQALQYGTTAGAERLREQVLKLFAAQEGKAPEALGISREQIVLTTGSQQMLSLACEVLLDPGDICLISGPTYFVFCGNLDGVGAEPVVIPADEHGMNTDRLEAALQILEQAGQLPRVKLIYSVSYYDNPSGISLADDRRKRIVELAKQYSKYHRICVLEDAAYRELRYDGPVHPSIWGHDADGAHVIYTQTFSKSFSPGIRVGFAILPKDLVKPVCDRKGNEDFGSSNFNQHLLATVLESGEYRSHVEQVCAAYRAKRDAMLAAADEFFADIPGVSWVHPHGGLYVWMSLPERVPTGFRSDLFRTAVAEGVMYVPGELSYAGPKESVPKHQMRLSYGVQSPEGIREGMRRLATAVRKTLEPSLRR